MTADRQPEPNAAAQHPAQQLQVQLGEHEAEGIYSNLVLVTHSPSEFVLDFARILPGLSKAKVYSRIVMTPRNTKSLLNVLQKNLEKFEEKQGKIPEPGGFAPPTREIGFR